MVPRERILGAWELCTCVECPHFHTRAGHPGCREMELERVFSVPWGSGCRVSLKGEGAKEALETQEWEPLSLPHTSVLFL